MKKSRMFSMARFRAMLAKEFIQMRRDRLTFAMMIGIPLLQLILFGYAINADPKHLPAAVLVADQGPEGRTLFSALRNSGYYDLVRQVKSEAEGRDLLARGRVQFVINIPENFSRDFLRGDRPELLVEADATDPGTTGNAIGSLSTALNTALQSDLKGSLESLAANNGPIDLRVHALYNPEAITHYNIVPCDYPRAGARHNGKSSFHADAPDRSARRQTRSLYFGRLRPGHANSCCSAVPF